MSPWRYSVPLVLLSAIAVLAVIAVDQPKSERLNSETTVDGQDSLLAPSSEAGSQDESVVTSQVLPQQLAMLTPQALPDEVALTPPPPQQPTTYERVLKVGKGDTLMEMLVDSGLDRQTAHNLITAVGKLYDLRRLRPGHEVTLTFQETRQQSSEDSLSDNTLESDAPSDSVSSDDVVVSDSTSLPVVSSHVVAMTLTTGVDRQFQVMRGEGDRFLAETVDIPLETRVVASAGRIDSSLYEAAVAAGVPDTLLVELIRAFSWDVDFQRDIHPGDRFEAMYELIYTEDGQLARTGNLLYAGLTLGNKVYPIYRHDLGDGDFDYFDDKGRAAKKALMRTPINGARLSSRFGNRKHPILGYNKMHRGVDFAAPPGTPIFAAGDGVIDFKGTKGGYGKYIRIRHNGEYSTAYAHMRAYAKGMGKGKRVRQGQVIGFVGSTGRSTGPHLHYEILKGGAQVNPLSVRMPTGRQLKGEELAAFEERRAALRAQYAEIVPATPVASAE